jgi:hypothetical protein
LLYNCVNYLLVSVADGHNPDTASEVNQLVAIDINQDGAVRSLNVYRK